MEAYLPQAIYESSGYQEAGDKLDAIFSDQPKA